MNDSAKFPAMNVSALLKSVPLFAGLGEVDLDALQAIARVRDCQRGELLFSDGERAEGFYVVLDGKVAYDEFLRLTDPKLVFMELDCFWTTFAGKDPVTYMEKYPGRFPLLHIKDLKPGFPPSTDSFKGKPYAEVGKGIIDWKRIFQAAPKGGIRFYYVEQDECDRPPIESIRISHDFLNKLSV